jgi:hypothetical protein
MLKPAPLVASQPFCEDQNLSNACKAAHRVETGKKITRGIANKLIGLRGYCAKGRAKTATNSLARGVTWKITLKNTSNIRETQFDGR